jgi:hypothetical protein
LINRCRERERDKQARMNGGKRKDGRERVGLNSTTGTGEETIEKNMPLNRPDV